MDAALVVITLLSLGLTAALLVYAARLQREAHQRSEARVAALAAEVRRDQDGRPRHTAGHPSGAITASRPRPPDASGHVALFRVEHGDEGDRPAADDFRRSAVPAAPPAGAPARSGDRAGDQAAHLSLFRHDEREEPSSHSRRLVAAGVGIAVVVFALVAFSGGGREGAAGGGAAPTRAEAPAAAAAADGPPLELIVLRHVRSSNALTVSGIVRNPSGSRARTGVAAVVFLFDRAGAFVTSGRAAIDYQALAAGEESPWQVTITGAGDIGRYRVSFRTDRAVVPHVDLREAAASADGRAARLR
jgi:hypothetical protein